MIEGFYISHNENAIRKLFPSRKAAINFFETKLQNFPGEGYLVRIANPNCKTFEELKEKFLKDYERVTKMEDNWD